MTKDKDHMRAEFEQWWIEHGQFCRAGGGDYEKTFAFRAYEAARASAPQGVPAIKTERMHEAMLGQYGVNSDDPDGEIDRIFAAMLTAAPQPVAQTMDKSN